MFLTRRQLQNIILKEFSIVTGDWEDNLRLDKALCRMLKDTNPEGFAQICDPNADYSSFDDEEEDEDNQPKKSKNQNPPRKDAEDALNTTIMLKLHLSTNEKIGQGKTTSNLSSREKTAQKSFGLKSYKTLKSWTWNIKGGTPVTITLADVNKKLKNKK